ncbi:MAG: NUDIX hydrolase, partial [Nocardioidaceae bacterium]
MDPTRPILAAGTLTWRHGMRGLQVLLVHRTRYDDWSFPKGKADPGEPLAATAARETLEETGYSVRLGIPLTRLTYFVDRPYPASKHVSYWTASARDADTDSPFVPNDE